MKKILCFIALGLLLGSCSFSSNDSDTEIDESATTAEVSETLTPEEIDLIESLLKETQ